MTVMAQCPFGPEGNVVSFAPWRRLGSTSGLDRGRLLRPGWGPTSKGITGRTPGLGRCDSPGVGGATDPAQEILEGPMRAVTLTGGE